MPKIDKEIKVVKTEAIVALPKQEKFFSTGNLKKSARSGTQLPDPTNAPYGYDAAAQFRHLFPALELPILKPPAKFHAEDNVSFGSPELPPHELYLGDNLYLLRQLPSESVDLIYIDPPFFSNRTYTQIWGDDNEVRSFNDIFQDGMFSYLAWLNARLFEMKRVLKSTGSIFVHCDDHASHYIKCELDKIFGYDHYLNEVIWHKNSGGIGRTSFSKRHDAIFLYVKSDKYFYDGKAIGELREQTKGTFGGYFGKDPDGREYREVRKAGKIYKLSVGVLIRKLKYGKAKRSQFLISRISKCRLSWCRFPARRFARKYSEISARVILI